MLNLLAVLLLTQFPVNALFLLSSGRWATSVHSAHMGDEMEFLASAQTGHQLRSEPEEEISLHEYFLLSMCHLATWWLNPLLASSGIPYRHRFTFWLLHFSCSNLPVASESTQEWSRDSAPTWETLKKFLPFAFASSQLRLLWSFEE